MRNGRAAVPQMLATASDWRSITRFRERRFSTIRSTVAEDSVTPALWSTVRRRTLSTLALI